MGVCPRESGGVEKEESGTGDVREESRGSNSYMAEFIQISGINQVSSPKK